MLDFSEGGSPGLGETPPSWNSEEVPGAAPSAGRPAVHGPVFILRLGLVS